MHIQSYSIAVSFSVCSSACTVWNKINFTLLLCLWQQWKRISKCGKKWKVVLSMVRSVVYVQRLTWIQPMAVCVTRRSTGARMNHIRKLVQNTSRYFFRLMSEIQSSYFQFHVVWIGIMSFCLKEDIFQMEHTRLLVRACHVMLIVW
jgi:hypothetical protein